MFAGANSASVDYEYVLTYDVDSGGVLSASYTTTDLSCKRRLSQVVVIGNYLYLIGGYVAGTGNTNTIYRSEVQADGSLGAFSLYSTLPATYVNFRAAVIKDRLYLFGGSSTSSPYVTSVVRYCPISSDGSLGTWTTGNSLSYAVADAALVVTTGYVYLIGGDAGNDNYTSAVQRAAINTDGSLGTWSTVSGIYVPGYSGLWRSASIVTEDAFYLAGGRITNTNTAAVYRGAIDASGSITSISTSSTSLNYPAYGTSPVVTSSRLYLFGGLNSTNTYTTNIFYTSFSGGLNDYTPFTGGTSSVSGSGAFDDPLDEVIGSGVVPSVGFGVFGGVVDGVDGAGSATIDGYGAFDGLLDDVSGLALSAIADGVFQGIADEVTGYGVAPSVGVGLFEGLSDTTSGNGSGYILGYGAFDGISDEQSGVAFNVGSTVYGTAIFIGIVDETKGSGENNVVIGSFFDPLDVVSGFGIVPSIGVGRFRDPISTVVSSGFIGASVASGSFSGYLDTISGTGVSVIIGYGAFSGVVDDSSAYATNIAPSIGAGTFDGYCDDVAGAGSLIAVGTGIFSGEPDSMTANGVAPVVGFGRFTDPLDLIDGDILRDRTFSMMGFYRCYGGITPPFVDVDAADPLVFSRCQFPSALPLSESASVTTLSFSRCES